jgi:CRP-like cAMP-binding protein
MVIIGNGAVSFTPQRQQLKTTFTPAFIERFSDFVRQYHPVPDEIILQFLSVFKPLTIKKGQVLVKQDEVCKHLYFVVKGSFRCFEIDENGREINHHFYFEDELASEFKSLESQEPSERNLVAMSPGKVMQANRKDYEPMLDNIPEFAQAAFRFFQELYFQEEERTNMLRKLTIEERYLHVLENHPHLLQRVSLTQLASWLGISRESLSRIRSKISA